MHPLVGARSRLKTAALALTLSAFVVGGGGLVASTPASAVESFVEVPGARILAQSSIDSRTISLTIATPSFTANTVVEVMLPVGYASDPSRAWPVTYFLGGTSDAVTAFRTRFGGEESTTAYPSIIVIPDGASGSWSDWYNVGAGGPPLYETFVTRQLIPLVDANFRTIADRSHRAVFGESMGGAGTMMFAARHPDLFVAASSLSGAVDSNQLLGNAVVNIAPVVMGALPTAIWGDYLTQQVRWRGHNATDLAGNLRDMNLQLFEGNGVLGLAQGEVLTDVKFCALESAGIVPMTTSFGDALTALAIPHAFTKYSWGCHSDRLFAQEIRDSLPAFLKAFGTPTPTEFEYRSVEPAFALYGWSVTADPTRAMEFLSMTGVTSRGLTVSGSGLTTITTPSGVGASVRVNGVPAATTTDADGRVSFTVDLGVANSQQQYRIGATTVVRTAHVALTGS